MESNKYKYQHTTLLYLVSECYKAGTITEKERVKIKRLILLKYHKIYQIFQKYEKDGNVKLFCSAVKELCKKTHLESNSSVTIEETDSLSSEIIKLSDEDEELDSGFKVNDIV